MADNLRDDGVENSLGGKFDDLKGKVKDAAGGLTGDTSMQGEGKWDQAKGKVKEAFGKGEQHLANGAEDDTL